MQSILSKSPSLIESIDSLYQAKYSAVQSGRLPGVPFSGDVSLTQSIDTLKTAAKLLSGSCTKLTMISTQARSEVALTSIADEVTQNMDNLCGALLGVLGGAVCWPLYQQCVTAVREMIEAVNELASLTNLCVDDQALRNGTGLVWKCCEDIEKLPVSNKIAYRRDILACVGIIKDTLREFNGYISEYDTNFAAGTLRPPSIPGEYAEDDFEEEDYTAHDVAIVRRCVELFTFVRDTLSAALPVISYVGDLSASELADSTSEATNQSQKSTSSDWIARISVDSKRVIDSATNLGNELFPPLDVIPVNSRYDELRLRCVGYLEALVGFGGVPAEVELRGKLEELKSCNIAIEAAKFL